MHRKATFSLIFFSSELIFWAGASKHDSNQRATARKPDWHRERIGHSHRKSAHREKVSRNDIVFSPIANISNATESIAGSLPTTPFLNKTGALSLSDPTGFTTPANDTFTSEDSSDLPDQNLPESVVPYSVSSYHREGQPGKYSQNSDDAYYPSSDEYDPGFNSTQQNSTTSYGSTSSTNSSETSQLTSAMQEAALQMGGLFLGFLPDDGSSGGTRQTMAQLNAAIGARSAVYGWYSQAQSGTLYDGAQLLNVIDDVKASKCIFQPAVMPIGGWDGLTQEDNSQAIAIANVMKKFTDEGIPVWLRFAHEMNYYQTDGTYQGTAADFKAGWAAVSAAVKQIAPDVRMWWTPNVDSAENYEAYEPDDMSTVDLVGIDFYPKTLNGNDFMDAMKDFHDKYAVDGRKFAIGETGLGWAGSLDEKFGWLHQICAAKDSLPEFVSAAWFNFQKEYDYQIAGTPTLDPKFTSFIANPDN